MFNANRLKLVFAILGIAAIVLAIVVFSANVGSYESNERYGGDAYTGMQQASAQAANNTMYVGEMLRTALGGMLALQGCVLLGAAVCIRKPETANAATEAKPEIKAEAEIVENTETKAEAEA